MTRTKIVCTVGPASDSVDVLENLIRAGMDVARLNFSHGTLEEKARQFEAVREAADRVGKPVAGPKIRTGRLSKKEVVLQSGDRFVLTGRDVPGDEREVSLTYRKLPDDVRPGDSLLLCDGLIELRVESILGKDIICRVVVGGKLGAHKGINLPSRSISAPFLTEKDKEDLRFGLKLGVDYVALSFVRTREDVVLARKFIAEVGGDVPIIAKIEKHEALENIDAILDVVDGIMVARGDLGVEIPAERVPRVQKMLIHRANAAAKPVITATQMLRSMVDNPRATRAEVADVANAVLDGTDAVMLSEETAIGNYPDAAVRIMSRVAADAEIGLPKRERLPPVGKPVNQQEAVADAACRLAEDINAGGIIACTLSGSTARFIAKCRPEQIILGATTSPETLRRLGLVWGVHPMLIEELDSQEELEKKALALASQAGHIGPGDHVVIVAGLPMHIQGTTNSIKVLEVVNWLR